jgi:hypothetical protein
VHLMQFGLQLLLADYKNSTRRRHAQNSHPTAARSRPYSATSKSEGVAEPIPVFAAGAALALREIDQAAIDGAAAVLFPNGTAATRNREVYTPVSAVLKRAGLDFRISARKAGVAGSSAVGSGPNKRGAS